MFSVIRNALASVVPTGEPLAVGTTAPSLTGTNQDGKAVNLGEIYQTGYVLVYFYPMADTPGCTAQACSLRDAFADLAKEKLTILGVSHDSVAAQKKFADKYRLPFDLLADPAGEIYQAFGVSGFNRQSFLIKNGKVIWRALKASTDQQAADVHAALAADTAT